MAANLEALKAYGQEVTRIGDEIHEQGQTLIIDTVMAGVFQNFSSITQGLSSYLIDGEAEFFPRVQVWKTRGVHMAYNPDFFQVLNQEEYDNKKTEGINGTTIIQTVFVSKSAHDELGCEIDDSVVFLVPTGKETYKTEDLQALLPSKLK